MTARVGLLLLLVVAIGALTYVAIDLTREEVESGPAGTVTIERGPPTVLEVPEDPVVVMPTDDLDALIDTYPIGTTFDLMPGTYRQEGVVPRHAQRFIGRDGVVFSGAVVLDPASFSQTDDGLWFVEDQTQEGLTTGQVEEGSEPDRHPEEVFVDGDQRLDHVGSLAELGPGSWHFDYDADRIYLFDDPAGFDIVETSVHEFAFGGLAVRDVVIANITVEKYASPHYYGALGGAEGTYPTYDWTYSDVVARYNHGAGIAVGPGTTVERSRIHHNGQIGLVGDGASPFDGYAATVTVVDSEIDHNLQLGFRWNHEGGGTKFKRMDAGMTFVGNWVHDNAGPGVWWDVYNSDVVVRDNLVEDNEEFGIYYEIGSGETVIEGNIARGNGRGGIEVSTSQDTVVRDNLVYDNVDGLVMTHDDVQVGEDFPDGTRNVTFVDNEVWLDGSGANGVRNYDGPEEIVREVGFARNTYHYSDTPTFIQGDEQLSWDQWTGLFPDEILGDGDTPFPTAARDAMLAAFEARRG